MTIEKVAVYDVTKVEVDPKGNTIAQIYFSGKFDRIIKMLESMTDGEFMLVAPRIAVAPNDQNKANADINQSLCSVLMEDNTIIINADIAGMKTYASTTPSEGSGKWVGILVNVGADTIIGTKYNNYALAQIDVADASACGGDEGEFILWLKADVVTNTPKVFTLSRGEIERKITVRVVDISK